MISFESLLFPALGKLGIERSEIDRVIPYLCRYALDLERGSARFGLLSHEDSVSREQIVERHIIDSLRPWPRVLQLLAEGRRSVFDLGSGAGLPGVPLAILFSEQIDSCILVERAAKRVRFLEAVRGSMPTVPLRIDGRDLFSLAGSSVPEFPESIAVIRAWSPADPAFGTRLAAVFAPGTPIVFYKGRRQSAEDEAQLLAKTGVFDTISTEEINGTSIVVARLTRVY